MKTQHTVYRQFRSVYGIASVPNTDFESLMPSKLEICSPWIESAWKHNAQYLGLHQYLGSNFRSN